MKTPTTNSSKKFSPTKSAISLFLMALLSACSTLYYSTWEQLGKEKRDLLRDNVITTREEQRDASLQFRDALNQLQESYQTTPSQLQERYEELKNQEKKLNSNYNSLDSRIAKLDSIATDLFKEWREEADTMANASFRHRSLEQLQMTKARYSEMRGALLRTQDRCRPVLRQLHDYVLFLKHNLNARAVGDLKDEASSVMDGLTELIKEVNKAISETDSFINTLESNKTFEQ